MQNVFKAYNIDPQLLLVTDRQDKLAAPKPNRNISELETYNIYSFSYLFLQKSICEQDQLQIAIKQNNVNTFEKKS